MKTQLTNTLMRLCLTLMACLVLPAVGNADTFKGKIVNAETGEILVGASINTEINPQPGWSATTYCEADSTGAFTMEPSMEGRIIFTFSMIGYKNYRKVDYAYGPEVNDTTDLGTIRLQPTALMLQEVVVKSSIPRITMSGDTIVFNPEAFKLKEGARLDELIKKLPGVENRNGKLFWKNKPIRLIMNGKDLFGGDAIINELPAEVAKKLKLYDRKSELARKTGNDDGEEDNVLDIEVKPGFLDKWYGEANAGYETKDRYRADITASKLSDHDPQMVYAQANNANIYIDRTMTQTNSNNIYQDGRGQYGSYSYQHNWLTKGAERLGNNRVDVSASMGHYDGWGTVNSSTETFMPNTEHTMALSRNYNNNHSVSPEVQARLKVYTDSINIVSVNVKADYERMSMHNRYDAASYGYDADQYQYHTLDAAMAARPGDPLYGRLIMRNRNYTTTDREIRHIAADYSWQHFIGKTGSFTIGGNTDVKGVDNERHTTRNLEYPRQGITDNIWQFNDNPTRNLLTSLYASLEQWLGNKMYVKLTDNITYERNRDSRDIFADTDESRLNNNVPTTPDADNSMNYLLNRWINTLTANATWRPTKDIMVMPKFSWRMMRDDADYRYGRLDTAAVRTSHAYEPSVYFKWKMSRVRNLDFSFAYNTTVPDVSSTFGYRSTLDPMNIETGNPLLANSHSHTTTFNYNRMWLRKQIVLTLTASYRKDINPVGTLYTYDTATGVYESKPVNVRGGDSWYFAMNYDQGLGVYFRVMSKFGINASRAYGYMTLLTTDNDKLPELNRQNNLGISHDLRFSYEAEKVRLTLSNSLQYNRYHYSDASYNNHPLTDWLGVNAQLKFSPFFIYINLIDLYRTGFQTPDMNGHRFLANVWVSYDFPGNKWSLTLRADDIFNNGVSYYSSTTAYQRSETSEEYRHHYLSLTVSYRFDAKESKKGRR